MRVGTAVKGESNNPPPVRLLDKYRKMALRRGTWFRLLSHVERSIIDLTVKYVENIKSKKLAKIVSAIISKLEPSLERFTDRLARTIGLPLAQKISNIAVSWGHHSAKRWAEDLTFARYLAVNSGARQKI